MKICTKIFSCSWTSECLNKKKNVAFEWTPICQESFEFLKTSLMTDPILTYPDPNLPYVLFTDASKYARACVLTQEKTHEMEEKEVKILYPITYT